MKETLDDQSRASLVQYRLERAKEALEEADILKKESHFNAAANRLYHQLFLYLKVLPRRPMQE